MNAETGKREKQPRAAARAASAESVIICDGEENGTNDKRDCAKVAVADGEYKNNAGNGSSPAVQCGPTKVVVEVIPNSHGCVEA